MIIRLNILLIIPSLLCSQTSKLDLQNTQAAQPTHSSLLKNSSRTLPKSESGAIDPSNLLGANASISTSTSTPQTPLGVELQSGSKTSTEDDGTTSPVLAETGEFLPISL